MDARASGVGDGEGEAERGNEGVAVVSWDVNESRTEMINADSTV
jgi:hypothetical protein